MYKEIRELVEQLREDGSDQANWDYSKLDIPQNNNDKSERSSKNRTTERSQMAKRNYATATVTLGENLFLAQLQNRKKFVAYSKMKICTNNFRENTPNLERDQRPRTKQEIKKTIV